MPGGPNGPLGVADHRPPAPSRHTQAISGCRASAASTGRILLVRLLNSSNTCYMNASVRAWLFAVSHLSVADVLKYGAQEQAWRDVYHTRRPIHVHALCSWKPLLRNWANLHMQHDACEFLEHILGAGRPQVLQGLMIPKLGTSITRIRLLRFISRTPVAPLVFSALSIIGIKEELTCKPVPTLPESSSCASPGFGRQRTGVCSNCTPGCHPLSGSHTLLQGGRLSLRLGDVHDRCTHSALWNHIPSRPLHN